MSEEKTSGAGATEQYAAALVRAFEQWDARIFTRYVRDMVAPHEPAFRTARLFQNDQQSGGAGDLPSFADLFADAAVPAHTRDYMAAAFLCAARALSWPGGPSDFEVNFKPNFELEPKQKIITPRAEDPAHHHAEETENQTAPWYEMYEQVAHACKSSAAFHRDAAIELLDDDERIIAFVRTEKSPPKKSEEKPEKTPEQTGQKKPARVLCAVNVTGREASRLLPAALFSWQEGCTDLRNFDAIFVPFAKDAAGKPAALITLEPHEVLLLQEGMPDFFDADDAQGSP